MINPFGTKTPPGGWVFYQPQLKWALPNPVSHTVASAATEILKVRRKNPAITLQHRLSTNRQDVEEELIAFNAKRLGVDTTLPKPLPRRLLPQVVEDLVVAVKRTTYGAAGLVECIREIRAGHGAKQDRAARRASVCSDCPKNGKGDLTRWFTVPASEAIRAALSEGDELKLSTPYDSVLGVCEGCFCPMKLKVHCGFESVKKHTDEATRAALDPRCWIFSEEKEIVANKL